MQNSKFQDQILAFRRDPKTKEIVGSLSKVQPHKQFFAIAMDWVIVVSLAIFCKSHFSWPLYVITVILIAGRQHALLAIMHEAAHFRISKNKKINDVVGNYFASYPILMTLETYRANHAAHHSDLNTDKDPDWVRKVKLKEWQYPMSKKSAFKVLARQIFVGGRDWMVLMYHMTKSNSKKMTYFSIVGVGILMCGVGTSFLFYWIVPLLTLFPLIQRIRSVAEHFGLPREHDLNGTRNVFSGPVESFFFGPHNINIHLAHHLFPTVPQYNLKKLHKKLNEIELYAQLSHNNDSYFISGRSVWKDLTTIDKLHS